MHIWNRGTLWVEALVEAPRGPWWHRESQAVDSWHERRVSSDMYSLKLATQTSWPRAQVSLPQPRAAHQPAPHWAGALKVEATKYPSSQQEVMGMTHSGQKLETPARKASVTSPNSQH